MKPSFVDLFLKHGSHTDKETIHHYGFWYDRWLGGHEKINQILELGCDCFGCGGLLAFSEYYPNATVVGIDIHYHKIADEVKRNNNISLVTGDVYQYEMTTMIRNQFPEPFQLIVDDCLHSPEDQLKAFRLWSPLLAPDGIYLIEDIYDLSQLSKILSFWTVDWDITLGDNRELFNGTYKESLMLCLRRNRPEEDHL
jgi:SAM-dependent methyltransferase